MIAYEAINDMEASKVCISQYISIHTAKYGDIFRVDSELKHLEAIRQRHSWMQRILADYEVHHRILFPSDWDLGGALCTALCALIVEDVGEIVQHHQDSTHQALLLACIQDTINLEGSLQARYPNAIVRLSSAFEPIIFVFIEQQDRAISAYLEKAFHQILAEDGIFQSASDLRLLMVKAIEEISKISTKKPLLDLCSVLETGIVVYADQLKRMRGTVDVKRRRKRDAALYTMAVVCNSCDYLMDFIDARLLPQVDDLMEHDLPRPSFLTAKVALKSYITPIMCV
jgi:vacuolar protein sorting-associated protein 53